MKVMDDLLGDFPDGAPFRVHQHVGLAIEFFARGKQGADFDHWLGVFEERAMALIAHAFPAFFRRSPKAHDQRVFFETGEIGRIDRQTSARGNHGLLSRAQFLDELLLQIAECLFAVLRENIADGFAGARLDEFVRVEELEMKMVRDKASDGRFAGAHETNESEV